MSQFNPNHLKTDELSYEISIRNITPPATVDAKRKVLRGLLAQESSNRSFNEITCTIDFSTDHQQATASLKDIDSCIQQFSGDTSHPAYAAISSRLAHLSGRISRLQCTSKAEEKQRDQLRIELIMAEADFADKAPLPSTPLSHSSPVPLSVGSTNTGTCTPIPVYKWGLRKFDGKQPLLPFLEYLDALKSSRGCTDQDLLKAAPDLFEADAFTWWHNHFLKNTFTTWSSLVLALKQTFLPEDYQRQLLKQIMSLRQTPGQSTSSFIANAEALFHRLAKPFTEQEKVEEIRQGLLPEFKQALRLHSISTISELETLCRKLEIDLCPPTATSSKQQTSYLSLQCWNCNSIGHKYDSCKRTRRKFCFGCGRPDIIKTQCPRCPKNDIGDRTTAGSTRSPAPVSVTNSRPAHTSKPARTQRR